MNGDEILETRFLFCNRWAFGVPAAWFGGTLADPAWGYEAAEGDGLLRRVAGELDAGRPAGRLIENATFRRMGRSPRYDIDAVDWFLGQLLLRPGPREPAGIDADPWRDLAVAQLTPGGGGFLRACQSAWRDFGQQHGTRLRWVKATRGLFRSARYELRTADQQTIASRVVQHRTVAAGGRSFTWKKTPIPGGGTAGSWPPGVAELATRSWRDVAGRFAAETMSSRRHRRQVRWGVAEYVDEQGTPVLYASGGCYNERATARVTFPDQRWLRFLVRGTHPQNAIMTAVDQAGHRVVRYRRPADGWDTVEITVNPDWKVTDELILAIAISAGYLKSYFDSPHG